MSRCANGHENPDGQAVCGECGLPLDPAAEEAPAGGSFWAREEARGAGAADSPSATVSAPPPEPKRKRGRTPAPAPAAPAAAAAPAPAPAPAPAVAPMAAAAGVAEDADEPIEPIEPIEPMDGVAAPSDDAGDGIEGFERHGGTIALVGAVLLGFGSFLPWAKLSAGLVYATKEGIDGNGVITLLIAVVVGLIAALGLMRPNPSLVAAILVLLGGIASGAVVIYEMIDVSDTFGDALSEFSGGRQPDTRVGVGLYLCLLAAALVVVGAVLALVQRRRAR